MPDENKSVAAASFNIEYLREGGSIVSLPIPDNLLRLIGLVAAHWGVFESQLDTSIAALLVVIGTKEDDWKRLGFSKRKECFVSLVRSHLEIKLPEIAPGAFRR